jgi:[acyl-carrier-protein] S-malonyltransferase
MSAPFAFVFPGQGSQAVGMLDAWGDHPVVQACVTEASDALGEDLGALIAQGPKEALALTTNTQPVMLLAGVAAYRAWIAETGHVPSVVAGHSLGEYSALVAAGSLSLGTATRLVRARAAAMQEAVPVGAGAMAAVLGMPSADVVAICKESTAATGEIAEAVNFNDPAQTVIAGSKLGVEKASELLKARGAKRCLPLPVSAPFHSSLMQPAAAKLALHLQAVELLSPQITLINNIDVAEETDAMAIKSALVRQAAGPVRWVECVQAIAARGITQVVECGPGKVLSGMCKRIDANLQTTAIFDAASLAETQIFLGSNP